MSVQRAYTSLKKPPEKHYECNEVQIKSWSDQLVLIIKQEKDELEIMREFHGLIHAEALLRLLSHIFEDVIGAVWTLVGRVGTTS